jgi:arylsulfatase A-like enzyme
MEVRRIALGLVLLCLWSARGAAASAGAPPPRPNIVYILADDLGWADVGYHGTEIKTPNIDRLAASGVKLESLYALPVCTPTRSALMTGRYPIRYGRQYNVIRPNSQFGLSLGERLLPEALREAGYATALCGKWHLGDFRPEYLPMARGFESQFGFCAHGERFTHYPKGDSGLMRDQKPCGDEGYLTRLTADEAVRRIEARDTGKPLFLYVAFNAVHSPLACPPEYSAPYARLGPTRSIYAGMTAALDEGVGRILGAIEKSGMTANTLVIFNSDNGGLTTKGTVASNAPLRAGKGSLYEGGVRVAACAAWPGRIPPGAVVREPLHIVDWYPTLLGLAGATLEQKQPLDGRDIWPTLTQGKPSPHDVILINSVGRAGAVRSGDWKLVRNGTWDDDEEGGDKLSREEKQKKRLARRDAPDAIELFNLAKDVGETRNLAGEQPDKVRELAARLDAFEKEAVPPILNPKPAKGAAREQAAQKKMKKDGR